MNRYERIKEAISKKKGYRKTDKHRKIFARIKKKGGRKYDRRAQKILK